MRMRRPARGGSFQKQQTGVIAPRSADSAPKETFGWPLLVTSALQAIRDRPLIRGRRGCGRRPGKDDRAGATKVNGAGSLGGPLAAQSGGTHLSTQHARGRAGPPVCGHRQARLSHRRGRTLLPPPPPASTSLLLLGQRPASLSVTYP